MLPEDALKDLLSQSALSKTDKLLLVLAVDAAAAKEVKVVKKIASNAGLRSAQGWNVSDLLGRSKGLAVRTKTGWELTSAGIQHVSQIAGALMGSPAPRVSSSLRAHLTHLSNLDVSRFLEEAISCYEARLYRASVVLSWVGAVAVLYDHVINHRLTDFNNEAIRRDAKWKIAKIADDLNRMKEKDFLDVCEAISIFGKSVKQELETCLKLRNGCGHPNSLKISEHRVAGHIESLMLNVFAKY